MLSQEETINVWTKELTGLADTSILEELQEQNQQLIEALGRSARI